MTTLIMADADYSPAGLKRRLKEEFARHGIESETEAAGRYGRPQQWLSRRMTGETEWKIGELEDFCRVLGISFAYVIAGIRELPPTPPPASPFREPQAAGARIHRLRPRVADGGPGRDARTLIEVQDDDESVDEAAIAYLRLADNSLADARHGTDSPVGESTGYENAA